MTDKKAMRDKASSLFLLGDVITEEMSFPRYTMIKQRKGAGNMAVIDPAGYIIADESTRTNIPGVFAVGNVRTKALRQVVAAVADGATAVHYAEEYLAGGM